MMGRDTVLYDRLEIPSTASDTEIKKSFLRLSKLWHPDKHPDEKKEEMNKKFTDIQQAKEILSDPEKRTQYDQLGMDMFNQPQAQQHHGHNPFHGFPGGFPGGFPFPGMQRQQQQPKEDIVVNLTISLEDIHNRKLVSVTYPCKNVCEPCNGEGSSTSSKCEVCQGSGKRVQIIQIGPMIQQHVQVCNNCQGTGKYIEEKNLCKSCKGDGFVTKQKKRDIPLQTGLETGHKMFMQGKGHYFKHGRSDLILVVNVTPHPKFHRFGCDLLYYVELTLYQSLFGFDKLVVHLDGKKMHLHYVGKTEPNTVRCIHNEGLQKLNDNAKGNLYFLFNMKLPDIPQSAKNEWCLSLQRLDENELIQEKKVVQDKSTFFMTLASVQDQSVWLSRYYKDETDTEPNDAQEQEQHQHQQHHPQQPGCAQQ